MNPQERIAVLERLLDRVKSKGARPHTSAVAEPQAAAARAPSDVPAAPSPAPPSVASVPSAASARPAPASAPPSAPPPPPARAPAFAPPPVQHAPVEPASGEWATAAVVSGRDPYPAEPSGDFGATDEGVQELELTDEELVDITVEEGDEEAAAVARAPSSADVEIDMEEEEEESPVSSRRARVAASIDEALAGAAEQLDPEPEREVPLQTPPPESGPQAALPLPPGLEQPPLPGEYDSGVHPAEEVKVELPPGRPTHAQLGQTIELEAPQGPDLELDMRSRVPPERAEDELEAALPDASVERMRPSPSVPPPEELQAERTERAQMHSDVAPASFSRAARPFAPNTFAELLDASLALSPE
ncbi:MAG TPA: hypothetical protein VI072_05355 [Polyangiaceae bacterium]